MADPWQNLRAQLKSGALNRRDFLAGAAALGISANLAAQAWAQTPKRGGHLVMGISQGGASDSFDPATWAADFTYSMGSQVYDFLIFVNAKFELIPWLAESWESKDGATVWVFKLRKGVTFHNGKPLIAQDVVYSIDHHRGKNSKSNIASLLSSVTAVKATGPLEVTITLSSADVDFPYMMGDNRMVIAPDGSVYDGIGTGAFILEKFEPGVRVLGKRNPRDWNPNRGYVDSIEVIAINDPAARLSALLSGSAHIINRVPFTSVAQVQADPRFQIFSTASSSRVTMDPDNSAAPYNNRDLRLALAYALDREAVLKTVFRGYVNLGNDHPIPSFMPEFAADLPQRGYDPDKARFHFKQSGLDGPFILKCADAAFAGAMETAQIFQSSATKAGVPVQLDRVPNDAYFSNIWRKTPFCTAAYGGRSTANIILSLSFWSASATNGTHWNNPKFDQALLASRAETDAAKRKQMYHDMQAMIHDDAASLIFGFNNNTEAGSRKVHGYTPSPVMQLANNRAGESVWLSES